jgi:hypothetical protein
MSRNKSYFVFSALPAGIVAVAIALGATAASAATAEVTLASSSQALTYCQSGKMPSGDIAYIAGGPGLVQYGPGSDCTQAVATKISVKKAIEVSGSKVKECKLVNATTAVTFCNSGSMGEWDIDYISGKVGKTISGPGYGCVVNDSTSSIGNAICK